MKRQHVRICWPRKAVLKLIKMWETNECLYNPKHNFYDNIHVRYAAFNQMADCLKMYNSDIGATEVKNKINCLRMQYIRELTKAKEKKSGADVQEEYIPAAYWYYDISFLHDYVEIKKGGCKLYKENSLRNDNSLDSSLLDCETSDAPPNKRSRVSCEPPQHTSQEDSFLTAAKTVLEKFPSIPNVPDGNDKVKTFCTYIQSELYDIKNLAMRDEVMKSIIMVIFDARKKRRMAKQRDYNFDSFVE